METVSHIINTKEQGRCSICLEDNTEINWKCGFDSKFCLECLTEYLSREIKEGNVTIRCPCKFYLGVSDVESIINAELRDSYHRLLAINSFIASKSDTKLIYCPKPNCNYVGFSDKKEPCVKCNQCSLEFCPECQKAPHSGQTCQEYDYKILTFII